MNLKSVILYISKLVRKVECWVQEDADGFMEEW
jgi:hypothetical protein